MTKTYLFENIDCANCAAKIESKLNAHPGVEAAVITFATKQLRLTAQDPDSLIPELQQLARTVENDALFLPKEGASQQPHEHHHHEHCDCSHDHGHHDHDHCGCDHDHEDHDHDHCGCSHGHEDHDHRHESAHDHDHSGEESPKPLILGAALFAVGLILGSTGLDLVGKLVHVAAYLVLGLPILRTAAKNLTRGYMLDENFLMSIATLGAFAIGEFPEAVGVMLFYRVGEFFEHRAVERSRRQIMDAVDLRPQTVTVLRGEEASVIPAADARIGDVLLVRPGDRIPLDGVVLTGSSRLDTAPITGESVPVSVQPGEKVVSGCVNLSGQLTVLAEKPLSESMVTRILNAVESAAASKPRIDRFITRFARIYTPVVVALAAAVALIPSIITGDWGYWVYTALSFLVMSCPCALVLSVPLAFFCGIGVGSKKGILFKGGASMEALAEVKAVAMDKTGTVTKGEFKVQDGADDALLALCAACEQYSTHPIAVSILAQAEARKLTLQKTDAVEEIPGHGIRARLGNDTVLCGNEKLMKTENIPVPALSGGKTRVYVAKNGEYQGCITIDDTLKDGAADAVLGLHAMDIHTAMLTGDNEASARAVAEQIGIGTVHAGLLPQQKLAVLQDIRAARGSVMFVGDGINDAPVLAGADVGAAMGSGADAALEAADVVFQTGDMAAIAQSIAIAKRTKTVAWQNVVFALAVKFLVMALGLMGYASMWLAVFADSGVAMLCVLNAVRMLYRKS